MIYHGRNGGPFILYAESTESREEWKHRLEEALGLRKVVQESNKVLEIESIYADTFRVPPPMFGSNPGLLEQVSFVGDVTCTVPFSKVLEDFFKTALIISVTDTNDARLLVAIGSAEGVWMGYRHNLRCEFIVLPFSQQ
jgi:hypothetical protein